MSYCTIRGRKMKILLSLNNLISLVLFGLFPISYGKNYEDDVVLTAPQKILLDKFRSLMMDRMPHEYMKEEIYLLKWLRTSEFNVELAENRVMNMLRWRKEQRMDTIHSEDWSDIKRAFKYSLEGRDRLGRSFLYVDVGSLDVRAAVLQGKGNRIARYADSAYEEGCTLVRELGDKYKNITRGHLIVNLDGYSIVHHGCLPCIPFLLRMVISYENNYPECVDKIILINTPASIEALLTAIRPLLTKETREALNIYGTNKKMWKAALSKDFDFDKLPISMGGKQIYKDLDDYD